MPRPVIIPNVLRHLLKVRVSEGEVDEDGAAEVSDIEVKEVRAHVSANPARPPHCNAERLLNSRLLSSRILLGAA